MQKSKLLMLLFLCLSVAAAYGSDIALPEVKVDLRSNEKPIQLTDMQIQVRIAGYLAQTTMKMKFHNPNNRVLEGELYFPLPESAAVSGYALDVNGVMIDGVAIEKQKAREVFETEVRRGVDPGIIEQVKGNNFKTRVYPLNPGSSRTIEVSFVSESYLEAGKIHYRLPLRLSKEIGELVLRIEVLSTESQPVVKFAGLDNPDMTKTRSGWFSETTMAGKDIESELSVEFPAPDRGDVFVEKSSDGHYYFSIQGQVDRPRSVERQAYERIAILFDASGSAANRDLQLEKSFLKSLFNSDSISPSAKALLVPFRNKVGKITRFAAAGSSIDRIFAAIDELALDGGTSFAGLDSAIAAENPDLILIFSDGLLTFGKTAQLKFAAPVYTISSVDGSDYAFLRHLANNNGGQLLNLREMTIKAAMQQIGAEYFGLVDRRGSSGIEEIYPSSNVQIYDKFMVVGRIAAVTAEVGLAFGSPGNSVVKRKFSLSQNTAAEGEFLRSFWAARKVDELLADKEKNRQQIVALSKRYGLVNEFTSLMVLERVEQYIEHKIIPPASKSDWRERYFEVVENEKNEQEQTRAQKLEAAVSMWQRRVNWWEGKDTTSHKGSPFNDDGMPREAMFDSAMEESFAGDAELLMRSDEAGSSGSVAMSPRAVRPSSAPMSESKSKAETSRKSVNPGVAVQAWEPDAEYVHKIKKAADPFAAYLQQKKDYGRSPSFFLDCADVFAQMEDEGLAIQILSNIAELELENPALLRVLAHRLSQLELLDISAEIFAEVLEMRQEEPQSYRDLALVLGRLGRFERAVELLYEVVLGKWDGRFPEIEVIALEELNNLMIKAAATGIDTQNFNIDSRLVTPLDVDLRIVMTWDADQTDMDLWVIEPTGEKAFYSNPRTHIGGLVSRDFTRGYGPEIYMIRNAKVGNYEIKTNFYGSSAQRVMGAVTLQVDIFTNYSRPDEKRRSVTLRLTGARDTFKVADVEF